MLLSGKPLALVAGVQCLSLAGPLSEPKRLLWPSQENQKIQTHMQKRSEPPQHFFGFDVSFQQS